MDHLFTGERIFAAIKLEFLFRGVVHEFLDCRAESATSGYLSGISMSIIGGGARGNNAEKYRRDAALIETALASETDPFLRSRYTFYLAQSYNDCGEKTKSLETYLQRAEMGFWSEEVYLSLLNAARLKESLSYPFEEIIETYQRAIDTVPTRAEAIHGASRYCRYVGRNHEGYAIAKRGIALSIPRGLFVEEWIYNYGLLDEFAINSYWTGHFAECLLASEKILRRSDIDDALRERVEQNAAFARERLAEEATVAPSPQPRKERRYVFITPYYKETRAVLEQCIASVRSQSVRADHILIADGFPQDWIDQINVRHVRLDRAHADWGNTPRCIGALMAAAEGYDGIAFLDADCWLEQDHLEFLSRLDRGTGIGRLRVRGRRPHLSTPGRQCDEHHGGAAGNPRRHEFAAASARSLSASVGLGVDTPRAGACWRPGVSIWR